MPISILVYKSKEIFDFSRTIVRRVHTLSDCEVRDFLFIDDFFCLLLTASMETSLSPEVERMLEFFRLSTLEVRVLGLGLEDREAREVWAVCLDSWE